MAEACVGGLPPPARGGHLCRGGGGWVAGRGRGGGLADALRGRRRQVGGLRRRLALPRRRRPLLLGRGRGLLLGRGRGLLLGPVPETQKGGEGLAGGAHLPEET